MNPIWVDCTFTSTLLEMPRGSDLAIPIANLIFRHWFLTPIILEGIMSDTTLIVLEWGVLRGL